MVAGAAIAIARGRVARGLWIGRAGLDRNGTQTVRELPTQKASPGIGCGISLRRRPLGRKWDHSPFARRLKRKKPSFFKTNNGFAARGPNASAYTNLRVSSEICWCAARIAATTNSPKSHPPLRGRKLHRWQLILPPHGTPQIGAPRLPPPAALKKTGLHYRLHRHPTQARLAHGQATQTAPGRGRQPGGRHPRHAPTHAGAPQPNLSQQI